MAHFLHALHAWWSYILAPFGLLGMFLTGRKNRKGWALSIFTQVLWLAYAVQTQQWGFIPGSTAYGGVYLKNFLLWKSIEEKYLLTKARKQELYKQLRYHLETALEQSDAEKAVKLLDELIREAEDRAPKSAKNSKSSK